MESHAEENIWEMIKAIVDRRLSFDQKILARASKSFAEASQDNRGGALLSSGTSEPAKLAMPVGALTVEGRTTYFKLKGDQLLHTIERARQSGFSQDDCEGRVSEVLEAYSLSKRMADGDGVTWSGPGSGCLPPSHPLRLELALKISEVLLYHLGRPVEAWQEAYPIYTAASARPGQLVPRALAIMQILRDHLAGIDIEDWPNCDENNGSSEKAILQPPSRAWSFLRVHDAGARVGGKTIASPADGGGGKRAKALAEVRRGRVCMVGANSVPLGSMSKSGEVLAALEQGQPMPLKEFLLTGPFLSWDGFRAICHDFSLASAALTHEDRRAKPLSSPPQHIPFAGKADGRGRGRIGGRVGDEDFLLTPLQLRIVFLVASSHRTPVAYFPETEREGVSKLEAEEMEARNSAGEDVYWRQVENMVLSGEMPQGMGLSFRQFIDALARCGLLGFSVGRLANTFTSPPERIQAVFTIQMGLLHKRQLAARLHNHRVNAGVGSNSKVGQGKQEGRGWAPTPHLGIVPSAAAEEPGSQKKKGVRSPLPETRPRHS